jgi:cyclophilin family peptidyl-prolyl cis-trans isomerase
MQPFRRSSGTHGPLLVALTLFAAAAASPAAAPPASAVGSRPGPVPGQLRARLKLAPFYQKHLDAGGLPVLGSARVSDNALAEAAWIIRHMLAGRDDIRKAMIAQKLRAVVMAKDEYTTDVPEHSRLRPKLYWDRRARGLGATPRNPVVSGAEENLLNFRRDPYPNENIFLHEFAHAVHGTGMNKVDPTFDRRLRSAYKAATERGLWKNTYAAVNHHEYWAEGVQSWFDDNAPPDALHNEIRTRALLKKYDPGLAALCKEVFGDGAWRYVKPRDRRPEDRAHLVGYDPRNVPRFRWRQTSLGERCRVVVQTAVGDFEVQLDPQASPAAANFLRVALDGGYHSGRFERRTLGAVWAKVNPLWAEKWAKELRLDPVPASTASPGDGTIALVRDSAGSTGFVVFVGDKRDAGGAEVVPIGRVVQGAGVVRKILSAPAREGKLTPAVEIRRVIRSE